MIPKRIQKRINEVAARVEKKGMEGASTSSAIAALQCGDDLKTFLQGIMDEISRLKKSSSTSVLMRPEVAAAYLDMTTSAIRQRRADGTMPSYCYTKLGVSVMFIREGLDRWIKETME